MALVNYYQSLCLAACARCDGRGRRDEREAAFRLRTWRAADRHTGIDKTGSIPYTYENVPGPLPPHAEVYRVECYVPFVAPTPIIETSTTYRDINLTNFQGRRRRGNCD